MKIQLVHAPCDEKGFLDKKWYPPLGLMSIGTYLEQAGYEVEILDGQHLSLSEIKKQISAGMVGINFNLLSTKSMKAIAQTAKNKGAFVLAGGQAATQLAKQLVIKNSDINCVVRFDGEHASKLLADKLCGKKVEFKDIPNLSYVENGNAVETRTEFLDLTTLPVPNRELNGIDLEKYIACYDKDKETRPTSAYTQKGCPRQCSFCARIDKVVRKRTPKQAFEEYQFLSENYGINYVFEVTDTWFSDLDWLESFAKLYEKEGGLDLQIKAFADIRDINVKAVE
ncbi:MAG: cobalamin-dependent protein, partial [Candidatus Diapherotrites archaeon]